MIRKQTSHAARHKIQQTLNKPKYLMPKGVRYNGKANNKTQKHRYRMPTGIGYERNTTTKPCTRCITTSNVKVQFPNHNRMPYKQSNQCSQASSPSVFCLGRDGRRFLGLCPGRTPVL
ncbi:hypothetical protein L873DRAFT_1299621 [Choiromyces venosus 120613-1]|uniref:Uncharacterized protein n=1 Tax=Choiromyces venosus 120613-1 TaxID=1336337 RepID=A0A3N4JBX2_9PEZI|nr:hypothetical protein L873DRAFT_1299621 [Choiromyces venosus 120613-1]